MGKYIPVIKINVVTIQKEVSRLTSLMNIEDIKVKKDDLYSPYISTHIGRREIYIAPQLSKIFTGEEIMGCVLHEIGHFLHERALFVKVHRHEFFSDVIAVALGANRFALVSALIKMMYMEGDNLDCEGMTHPSVRARAKQLGIEIC